MSLRLTYADMIRHALDNRKVIAGYTRSGAPVYAVFGADEGGAADGGGNADTSGDTDSDDDGAESEEDSTEGDGDDEDPKAQVTKAKERMKAADRRASQLERELNEAKTKLKDREDAELGELDKAKRDLADARAELDTIRGELSTMRLHNAFLSVNTVTWHEPDLALSNLDMESVVVGDDGKIDRKSLKAAIKKLAAEKPFLVKSTQDGGSGDSSSGASGSVLNGRRKGETAAPDRESLEKRFPALRRG